MGLIDLRGQAVVRDLDGLIEHMGRFEIVPRFSAGIWYFSPAASRFHARYGRELGIEERLETAGRLAAFGLSGIEAHYPNEINEENVGLWRSFCSATGIRLITVIPLLFWDAAFEFGSLSNPDEGVRRMAIDRTIAALRLNRELATDFAVVWPGIDGYEHGFGMDFAGARRRFAEGLAEAMDAVPGVRIAFEPKPYEPRGRILYGTTPEGVLLGRDVEAMLRAEEHRRALAEGHAMCCMNPEVGHVLMGFEELAYAFSWPLSEGRLAHTHWNSQPLGNYDQDLGVGVMGTEQTEALVYTLKMHGYSGYFGIDINPERVPVDIAVRNSMDAIRAACERVQNLDHEAVLRSHMQPGAWRGWLEGYLVRVRAGWPASLGEWKKPGAART
ncbi:MAG: TIM barrel protein [Phycisphaeraceae bacterium]|nr:TIM barrel protein [Phycisphaeraceae bacterium]MCW5753943.1 TIM barrel protein [Phycisphaeraceae bacterium]